MAEKLKQAILNSGRSLNSLAKESGVDHGRLSRFIRGERDLTFAAAMKVCQVVGLVLVEANDESE